MRADFTVHVALASCLAVGLWNPARAGVVRGEGAVGGARAVHARQAPARAEFEALEEEFASAVGAWKARQEAAEGLRERSAIRREHPAILFVERFEPLADAGDARALAWLLQSLDDVMKRGEERTARRLALAERLAASASDSPHYLDAVGGLLGDRSLRKEQGMGALERLAAIALGALEQPADRDLLRFGLARAWSSSREDGAADRAAELLELVVEGGHLPPIDLRQAEEMHFALLHLRIGKPAPDFEGRSIDGEPVTLGEHRGKVVVLNFFGFW